MKKASVLCNKGICQIKDRCKEGMSMNEVDWNVRQVCICERERCLFKDAHLHGKGAICL